MTLEPHARAHRRAVALGVFAVACGSAALGVHHFTGSLAAALALRIGLCAAGVAVNLAYGRRDHRQAEALASALHALARGQSPPALPQGAGEDVASDAFLRLRDHVLDANSRL